MAPLFASVLIGGIAVRTLDSWSKVCKFEYGSSCYQVVTAVEWLSADR